MLGNWLGDEREVWNYWHWNQQHKSGKLLFYTLAQAWDALQSDNPRSARRQYQKHKSMEESCPKRCSFPKLLDEMTPEDEGDFDRFQKILIVWARQ